MKRYAVLMLVLSSLLLSCEKDRSYPDFEGTWVESHGFREFTFSGTSFVYGSASKTDPKLQYWFSRGNYSIEGNKIHFRITQQEWFDQIFYKEMKAPVITNVNQPLMDDATFKMRGDELTINYTSYPSDSPMPTKAVFKRR